MEPTVFIFDIFSHFNRIWNVKTKDGIPNDAMSFRNGEPVFCLKPLLNLVQNEIRAMERMGIVNTHIAIVFDPIGKNFRHDLFPDYKGNRPPKLPERKRQEELIYEMFQALGYPCLRVDGVEADDVIATLAVKLSANNIKSYLFTGDKDIMSLCDSNTFVYAGVQKKLFSEREVRLKFNLPPERIIDFLAMMGDTADNIAGIKGVGGKSATKMLTKFTLDEILAEPDIVADMGVRGVKGMIKTMKEDRDSIFLMRKLVGLKTDVQLDTNLKELVCMPSDKSVFLNGFLN